MKQQLQVLMVEDSEDDALLLTRQLEQGGFEVHSDRVETANTLASALRSREWDMILCDYKLPKFSGMEALSLVKEQGIDVPFIFVSGTMGEETAVQAMKAGADDYVMKGNLRRLIPAIEREQRDAKVRSARKRAEAELQLSERRLFSIYNTVVDAIYLLAVGNEGSYRFVSVNDAFCKVAGLSKEMIVGRLVNEVIPEPSLSVALRKYRKAVEENSIVRWEETSDHPTGRFIGDVSISPVVDDKGRCTYLVGSVHDITERRKAEQQINLLAHTVKSIAESVSITDMNDTLLFVNHAFLTTYGYSENEILGKNISVLQSPKNPPDLGRVIRDAARVAGWQGELLNRAKDGREFPVLLSTSIVRDDNGRAIALVGVASDITERKKAEETRLLLSTALESTANGVVITDLKGTIAWVNKAFSMMTGYSGGEVIGQNPRILKSGEQDDLFYQDLWKVISAGSVWTGELINKKKDGCLYSEEMTITPLKANDGGITNYIAIKQDITARRQMEAEIHYEQSLLRALLETVPDHIYFKDRQSRFLRISKSLADYFALHDPAEAVGRTDFDFFDEKHARQAFDAEHEIIRTGKPIVSLEEKESWPDGRASWVSTSKVPLRDSEGRIIGTFGISRDITERVQADAALKASQQNYRKLFEESKDAIFISTVDSKMLDINPAGVEMLGYDSKEEVLGLRIDLDIFADPERRRDFLSLMNTLGYVKDFEAELKRKDGRHIYVVETASAIRDDAGTIIGSRGIVRDVSEKRQLEQELIQAQKMESIGTLASGIAHDFNNILGIILGYTSIIERTTESSEILRQSLQPMKDAVERGAALVKQILTFARKSEVVIGPIDPNIMVKGVSEMLRETFPSSIAISTKLAAGRPLILADATQLHQAILNLCVNARDAMPGHGTLTLSTELVSGSTLRSGFPDVVDQNYFRISVADTGAGIDEATRRKIFDPFFTTKAKGKGTGLGLSVVYGVMKNLNGFVNVESEPGNGAKFNLYFPLTEQPAHIIQESSEKWENIPGGDETILFVEDEESMQQIVKTFLGLKGYHVISALDGREALRIFTEQKDQIALVLSDIGLPRLSGIELCHALRRIAPNLPVILASGYIDPNMKSEVLKEGGVEFVQKPYAPSDILNKLRRAIDESRLVR